MEFPRRATGTGASCKPTTITSTATQAPHETWIDLSPGDDKPIGFVICTNGHSNEALDALLEHARHECKRRDVRLAVVHVGGELDGLAKINDTVNGGVNACTAVLMLNSQAGSSANEGLKTFIAVSHQFSHLAYEKGALADDTIGMLAHPLMCSAEDAQASQLLDDCLVLCDKNKAVLHMVHKELQYLHEVEVWSHGQTKGADAKDAIEEMLQAGEGCERALDLNWLGLTSLPPLPDDLVHLEACNNCLTVLPKLPSTLKSLMIANNDISGVLLLDDHHGLEELAVSNNNITQLRLDARALTALHVSGNRLTSLALDEAAFLKLFYASDNPLRHLSLPDAHQLERVDLKHTELTSLPESVLTIQVSLDLWGTPLPMSVLLRLRELMNDPAFNGPRIGFDMGANNSPELPDMSLAHAVAAWCDAPSPLVDAWARLPQQKEADDFSRFLVRLLHTPVGVRESSKHMVVAWLSAVVADAELCALTLAVAEDATSSCDDRVSLTFNKMQSLRTCHEVTLGKHDQDVGAVIRIARGMFRLAALEKVAAAKAATLKLIDEIEVHLAYIESLHEALAMPGEKPEALFTSTGISGVTQADLAAAAQAVKDSENTGFPAFLANWAPWRSVLRRTVPSEFDAAEETLTSPDTYAAMASDIDKELDALQLVGKARDDAKTLALRDKGDKLATRLMLEVTQFLLKKSGTLSLLEPSW